MMISVLLVLGLILFAESHRQKIIKSRGPSTEPCGTPWEMNFVDDYFRSIEVYWTLSHIKDLNQSKLIPLIP